MTEPISPVCCQLCGGPVSKKNVIGFCSKTVECRRAARHERFVRWYPDHKETAAASWAAWYAKNKDQRAGYRRSYRQEPENRERCLAYTREFKTRPENAERVREYNRKGRQRYMARADRPCLSPDGCTEHARVGSKWCPGHQRIEMRRHYHRTTSKFRLRLAERQDWTCPWCGSSLPLSARSTHVDHIIPRASGLVIEEEWNLQLLHGRCNQQKSDKITPQAITLAAEHGLPLLHQYNVSC